MGLFKIVARPSVARHFKFCDQIRTSSRSGPANISEGFWRYRPRDNARFVRIALGSLGETANHLNDAFAENYIGEEEYKEIAKASPPRLVDHDCVAHASHDVPRESAGFSFQ